MSTPKFQNSERNQDLHYVHVRRDAKEYKDRLQKSRKNKDNFGSQEVDVKDFIISPEGWEGIMFTFYFLSIPYITGIIFLFLFIARADMENFLVFDLTAFFVVWAIGYEIVASLILITIFISYLKYMTRKENVKSNRVARR
ncbi:MAG: hypothetical protein U9N52_05055 [Campylobacterota bacterium]|nr:hypothetical protein [Campylobacterota bacterium]